MEQKRPILLGIDYLMQKRQDRVAYYTLEQIPGTNKNTIDEKIERGRVNFSVNTKEVTNG